MLFPKNKIIIGAANFGSDYGFVKDPINIDLRKQENN